MVEWQRVKCIVRGAKVNEKISISEIHKIKKIKGSCALYKFRFEDLEIWKISIELTDKLLNIADNLETKKLY